MSLQAPSVIDEVAFERLIQQCRSRIRRIARIYAPPDEHEDLAQEIMLQLWIARTAFRGQAQATTWLYRVALNTALSHQRRRPPPLPVAQVDTHLHSAGDPVEPQQVLSSFLSSLDEVNRSVLLLSMEGLNHSDIAEVTGMRPGAIATRLTRLRKRFELDYIGEAA